MPVLTRICFLGISGECRFLDSTPDPDLEGIRRFPQSAGGTAEGDPQSEVSEAGQLPCPPTGLARQWAPLGNSCSCHRGVGRRVPASPLK